MKMTIILSDLYENCNTLAENLEMAAEISLEKCMPVKFTWNQKDYTVEFNGSAK